MAKTVFVLGAGASHEAGAPLMRGFFEAAWSARRGQHISTDDIQAFDTVDRARAALTNVHSKAAFDIRNVESVFGAFEMARMFGRLPPLEPKEVSILPDAIRRVIVRTLEWSMLFPFDGHGNVSAPSSHLAFARAVRQLFEHEQHGAVGVVTFNYDVGLDYALGLEGFHVDYCLGEEAPREPNHIEVAKLHGSLNWWICSNLQCTGYVETWHVRDYLRRHPLRLTKPKAGAYLAMTDHLPAVHDHCNRPTIAPYIVPPTWSKGQHHEKIAVVWRRAARMLSEAENIVVIGYSWPPSDEFFHQLFALGSVGRTFLRRFWIFDPNAEIERRYTRMLGPQATDPDVFQFARLKFSETAAQLTGFFNSRSRLLEAASRAKSTSA
jgi:NAD-dependent SIR2 family protein deacetylase